jgi:hypothetical protein
MMLRQQDAGPKLLPPSLFYITRVLSVASQFARTLTVAHRTATGSSVFRVFVCDHPQFALNWAVATGVRYHCAIEFLIVWP